MRRFQELRRRIRRRLRGESRGQEETEELRVVLNEDEEERVFFRSATPEEEDTDEETEEGPPNTLGYTFGFNNSYEGEQDDGSDDVEVELREAIDDEETDCKRLQDLLNRAKSCYWKRRLEIHRLPQTDYFRDHLEEFQQRELNEALGKQIVRAAEYLDNLELLQADEEAIDAESPRLTMARNNEEESLEEEERLGGWVEFEAEEEGEREVEAEEEGDAWEDYSREADEEGEVVGEVEVEVEGQDPDDGWVDRRREGEEDREIEVQDDDDDSVDYSSSVKTEDDNGEEGEVVSVEEEGEGKESDRNEDRQGIEAFECKYCFSDGRCDYCASNPPLVLHAAFDDVGKKAGLEVWRLDGGTTNVYNYVRVRKNMHGEFFRGQCYLILNTVGSSAKLSHHIHFWHGRSSQIRDRAAVFHQAMLLSKALHCPCAEAYEIYGGNQNGVSPEFLNIFKKRGIMYVDGEHAVEYHIHPYRYKKLFYLEEIHGVVCLHEVNPGTEVLEHSEYMCILDLGAVWYVWDGGAVRLRDRYHAETAAKNIASRRATPAEVRYVSDAVFWKALGARLVSPNTVADAR